MSHDAKTSIKKTDIDTYFMRKALDLASRGRGFTSPNPIVGALVVKEGKIIGRGYHRKAGGPHAEVVALNDAGKHAEGSTLYVTLEPCCHFGKTPPCTKKIIEHKVKKVVFAVSDPNPLVKGKGMEELLHAGIQVESGVLRDKALRQNEVFFKFIQTGIPFVTIKSAVTADGKTATVTGDSKWISGEASRQYTHFLRFINDGIMVGVNTLMKDDPFLTCRLGNTEPKHFTKIIVDSSGKTPVSSNIFKTDADQDFDQSFTIIIATTEKIEKSKKTDLERIGATVLVLPEKNGKVDILSVFQNLGKLNITSVLVEGGSELVASIVEAELADKLVVFIAPKLIGGKSAPTLMAGLGASKMGDSRNLFLSRVKRFEDDIMLEYYFKSPGSGKDG